MAFNVSLDAPELITVANQRIIALVLPKRLAAPLKHQVGSFRGGRLEQVWKLRYASVLDRSRDELHHGRRSEKGGASASVIEPAVHGDEGLAGSRIGGRKGALCRKTVVPAEGDEQRPADDLEMREPASFQIHVGIVRPA